MHQLRTASGMSRSSATEAVARPRCTRPCSSRPARPTALARWSTAPRSPTPTTTSRPGRCRSRASLNSFEWMDRKVNLIDTPGDPQLRRRRARRAARVRVGGVRRQRGDGRRGLDDAPVAARRGARHRAPDLREHARPRARRLLPHARLASRPPSARTSWRPRSRSAPSTRSRGVIDLVDMKAYEYDGDGRDNCREIPIPDELAGAGRGVPREAHGRGRRGPRGPHGALPRGRGDLPRGDRRPRSRTAPTTATSSR